jgi:hypothetical protein
MCDEFIGAARKCGLARDRRGGRPRPDVLNAVTTVVIRGIWFGLTEAYLGLMEHACTSRSMLTYTTTSESGP